ncbi:Adaptor protein complex AP-2 alpha subunit [Metschnikowia bicuspidata var. bicuspidata NRRL YB-4993]|uniref:AP-2 complex subunit alpha n=1 Tax=Metschnikowia bicuspidata var. bicuspidata NRRL YB-4993 TaxID=869754 RepID=A0A1A0HBN4_9ASCO|nr:Adaptor protein complex AP-2 alpha subunit [Metschnikowia bicuspidata var. bicuspidata NRRL YB-4993]OBA21395.1 Adaptor protein complex AP-2 alpha subunit [Metschnikowia bicuspidata var. bicuspidata NRRL YB-4993]
MAPHMKGLHQFISDLRNAADAAEETRRINAEIHNIKTKHAGGLDSYQKKKYVCKLLYIQLAGHGADTGFGLTHALDLLHGPLYLEKRVGYLAVSILYTYSGGPRPEHLEGLVVQTHEFVARDLRSGCEDTNALALLFVASAYAGAPLLETGPAAEACTRLTDLVYGLCVSPVCVSTVKMRALAALLVLARAQPRFAEHNDTWTPRLLALLDERDMGVVTCTAPLAAFLFLLAPHHARAAVPRVAALLEAILDDNTCPPAYLYHGVPAPWLVVKLLQLVEHAFTHAQLDAARLDQQTLARLRQAVLTAIHNATQPSPGQSAHNVRSAVLFQAVSIAPFLDASREAIHGAIHALALLLGTPETNTRYLVLDALVKLCVRSHRAAVFLEYFDRIAALLHDKDVSVRKKTLDLLFAMCDELTYTRVTACLLDYFPRADVGLKTDVLVKVAVLAERFATDALWYVSTMLRLLALGGLSSRPVAGVDGTARAGDVWERILQIVVNNEDLQKTAAKYVLNILRKPETEPSESIFKVAAFVLGEFGHKLVASEPAGSHFGLANQFQVLLSAYLASSVHTRPLIMNAFLKFVMHFPHEDFVPDVLDLFDAESSSLDLEIQTRAHEYLKVATLLTSGNEADAAFAASLVQPLPPFESSENKLITHLGSLKILAAPSSSSVNVSNIPPANANGALQQRLSASFSLLSAEDTGPDPFGDSQITKAPQLSPNWYDGYHRMLQFDVGIFYEDQLVKLTYRIVRDGPTLRITFTIINNAAKTAESALTAFTVHDIHSFGLHNYLVSMPKIPELKIPQKSTMELEVKVRDIFGSKDGPILAMSYKCGGSFNTLNLKVPVVLTKTLSGTSMSSIDEFKRRWIQIGEVLGLEKGEMRAVVSAAHRRNSSTLVMMLQRLGLSIIQSTPDDPQFNILVTAAGILRTVKSNCGVLVTVKSIRPDSNDLDVIVRSTGPGVPAVVHDIIRELLNYKH